MTPRPHHHLKALTALAALAAIGLTGCATTATPSSAVSASTPKFPITIDNCGTKVTIAAAPKRIVLVNNDELPNLEALDAIDRVVGVTAPLTPGLYAKGTYTALDQLTALSSKVTSTGGSVVSQESLLGTKPDLVIAPENAVDRNALEVAGVPLYTPSAYCTNPGPELSRRASFARVWTELRTLGDILGEPQLAAKAIASGEATVGATNGPNRGTAAALYVSSGGSVLSPYGGPSMVTPVFAAAGLKNVYAGSNERVFDSNIEDIIAKNPKTIVLLYSGGDPQDTVDSFLSAPGVSGLSAVEHHRVIALQFPYTDPPSTLTVKGPAALTKQLDTLG